MIKDCFNFAAILVIRFFTLLTLCSSLFISHLGFACKLEPASKELIFKLIKSISAEKRFKYSLKISERGKKG
jgi:hypothetical protein